MKRCSKCKTEKDEGEFCISNHAKDGLMPYCRKCESERKKEYRKRNKEKVRERKAKRYQENKESLNEAAKARRRSRTPEEIEKDKARKRRYYAQNCEDIKEKAKVYRKENREYLKEYHKEYNKNNKEKLSENRKKYYEENKEKFKQRSIKNRKKTNKWFADKRKNDPCFKLRQNISVAIREALRKRRAPKNNKTWESLPYTPMQLVEHLEKQFDENMNWDNYGSYWHIDHIIPHSRFKYEDLSCEDFFNCWKLSNLRPLEKYENLRKSDKILEER